MKTNDSNLGGGWAESFPIRQSEEHAVTRRAFTKSLGLISLAALAGSAGKAARGLTPSGEAQAVPVAQIDELPVSGCKLFGYPTANDPCILVRLASDQYAAFSQSCTHLACPVHFNAQRGELVCPCHEGYFSARDGRPLSGPPRRPLTQYAVEIRGQQIWVKRTP